MKKTLIVIVLLVTSVSVAFAQGERSAGTAGCTDPTASNYREGATIDDGSCKDGNVKEEVERIQAENAQRANATPKGAQSGFTALAPIPGLTDTSNTSAVNSESLANFFNNLYKYLIGLAAVLAVVMIIWGGLEIAFNKDSVSKITDAKGRIVQAILGLILVLSPVLVFSIINPSILNLSVNLPELKTKSSTPIQTTPRTLPICNSIIRKNCIPRADAVNAVAEGLYTDPQSGGWCYQIKPLPDTSQCVGFCNYVCGNQTQCGAALADEKPPKGSGANLVPGAACTLYAK
ncbi:hypothetical protein A3A36_02765 [Candidatus Kaiserbacteria bacterium RIFCSPLOWO2_01_FULL_52_12b]|uniref:Uncharacterized protein n=1 Tax=Candidatus Kaiserbacteria bacterium RIFCSPLOWO2_01_FULL_52_12b TaxID=1798509 RepID=A0A1F6EWR9_9BACT|nr:MAG: hypothetical protein A3A36_02765 [Candidatus Kaiserbacteria bacterium RIFCSPLOWO2_01_FULL_52_12b]